MKAQTENSTKHMVTLNPGSKRERQFDVNLSGQIPDLWNIAHIPELNGYAMGSRPAKDMILETWQLAHDMQKALAELVAQRDALRDACQAMSNAINPALVKLALDDEDPFRIKLLNLKINARAALALCELKDKEGERV